MNKELFVSSTPHETRLAVAENGEIAEVYIERELEYSLAGSIYKGRVTRVLPGMQSAFVDIGLERDAFLYVSDFFEDSDEYDRVVSDAENAVARLSGAEPAVAPALDAALASPDGAGELPRSEAPREAAPYSAYSDRNDRPQNDAPRSEGREGDRDRGRRGRNRGRRGRAGFPGEKFASPEDMASPTPTPVAPPSGNDTVAPMPAFVLPGESLAKYRNPAPPPAPPVLHAPPPAPRSSPPVPVVTAVPERAPQPAAFVLPGESLAKYRNAAPAPIAAPAPLPREEAPEPVRAFVDAIEAGEQPEEDLESTRQHFEQERIQEDFDVLVDRLDAESGAGEPAEAGATAEPGLSDPETEGDDLEGDDASAAVRAETGEARLQAPARSGEERPDRGRRRRGGRRRGGGGREGGGRDAAPGSRSEARSDDAGPRPAPAPRSGGKNDSPRLITDLLHAGQEILVQIAKEPLGKKGARITSHLALPGRFLVYMPTVTHIGVSRRIASDEERARLKRLLLEHTQNLPGGFIVRTAGAGASEEDIAADIRLLAGQWNELRQQFEQARGPALLHHDLNLTERTLRDQLSEDFIHIWVDTDEQYQRVVKFVSFFMPQLTDRVRLYSRDEPMFDHFGVQQEINNALKSKVWLKSGGYIVLNQTEALVAIDVNTGKYVGRSNRLEDTIVKTNVEAIQEIVRQIRLRDLGGIIVIDFIDMDERRNRQKVMQALEEAMRADRAPSKVLAFNDFGLVALTRKRVKQSLERTLGAACPYCEGVGLVKSPVTVCNEIFAEMKKVAPTIERDDVVLRVHPEVAKVLKLNGAQRMREIEDTTRKVLAVRPDPQVHQERFEIY